MHPNEVDALPTEPIPSQTQSLPSEADGILLSWLRVADRCQSFKENSGGNGEAAHVPRALSLSPEIRATV